jgi:radical SAM protein with 4Fe4S-binding SPASM domain
MKPKQYRFMQLQGLHVLEPVPKLRILVLDIFNTCNFQCRYCYGKAESFKSQNKLLQYKDYIRLMDEAVSLGVKSLWFLGAHENTLNPNYLRLLEAAEKRGLFTVTFSNGAPFGDDVIAKKIFGMSAENFTKTVASFSRSSVIIKCDSLKLETQNLLARNKNARQQIKKAIQNAKKTELWSPGINGLPRFGLNSVLTSHNYGDVANIFQFCLENKLAYFCDALLSSGAATKEENLAPISKQVKITLKKIKHVLQSFEMDLPPEMVVNFYDQKCILFDNYIFIIHDGRILPCAGFPENSSILGHVNEGLTVLWEKKSKMISTYYKHCSFIPNKCPCRAHLENHLI